MSSSQICPLLSSSTSADPLHEITPCREAQCAWWQEEAGKCAMAVLAETAVLQLPLGPVPIGAQP